MKRVYYIYSICIALISGIFLYKNNKKLVRLNNKEMAMEKTRDIVNTNKKEYTYEELTKNIEQIKDRYSELIDVNILDKSLDNRNIYEIILGNKSADKHFLIHAGLHGREYLNCLVVMKILEEYLKVYYIQEYKGIKYRSLFEKVAFHIIPMVNPDGVTISEEGINKIKNDELKKRIIECYKSDFKNNYTNDNFENYLNKWKANSRGVDLNRNFNADWNSLNQNTYYSFKDYKGDACESEIETKVLVNLTNSFNFVGTISYHSSGNLIYWDYKNSRVRIQSNYLADVAKMITGYEKAKSDSSYEDVSAGGYKDWVSSRKINPIPSITLEVGDGECPLEISEFDKAYNCNRNLWLEYAYLFSI